MIAGEVVTQWTIRVALLLYAAVVTGHLWFGPLRQLPPEHHWRVISRSLWSLGCIALVLHVGAAFHYYHAWSQSAALADTAQQTREALGVAFGAGLYFNYVFAVLWMADVAWWWVAPTSFERRPVWVTIGLHAYLLFIAVNATVVFESGMVRGVGVAVCIVWSALALRRMRQHARKAV